jgi:hypothetical protein
MKIRPRSSVYNGDQTERLRIFEEVWDDGGADFHSMVWARLVSGDFVNGEWETRKEITSQEFQAGCAFRRWVARLHSFSPTDATAIIQVGEGDVPMDPPPRMTKFNYSWRLWDLENNRELKILKQCENPFEEL